MSTDDNKLSSEIRSSFGKGAARKLRAAGKVPAVLYGHGTEPQHLTFDAHDVFMLVRRSNAVLDLQIEGSSQLALVKDIQRNPVLQGVQAIEHLDLVIVQRGEKVTVDVPVHLEGESAPGTITNFESTSISIEVEALHIPDSITVSIEGLEEGAHVLAGQVELPKGATLLTDPEALVVGIIVPAAPVLEDEDAAPAEGETAEAEAEGESEESAEGESAE
ncbi:50S ribosomal protein L25/general stress protein Ctc [Agrococcus sp. SCSIO52902]|jgi:large subunit ribosomal protein L25|uniref:50S ribosomal protein L25/general stress protein Ctc n=1 Tax=Agrococcus sp. SCSIO52902 TaxID=2933290 RepID=UPI001FF17570|nr:50S ribosomal protein L25/general stress protein Ctc [Agrococcus sp. SCSIO52902]UOW01133.1 50S ribosomal protein L25/general stress protein Ctc [Agrococcus sp. SCSIO52902]